MYTVNYMTCHTYKIMSPNKCLKQYNYEYMYNINTYYHLHDIDDNLFM